MLKNNASNTKESYGDMGFTLIEVMIAMVIFAIGILAMFSMQISATNTNAAARVYTQESNWAVDRIEKLMRLPYGDADLSGGDHSVAAGNLTQATDGIDNDNDGKIDEAGESGPITISWTVQDNVPELNTKSIVVTVTQNIFLRGNRTVTFDFIRANL